MIFKRCIFLGGDLLDQTRAANVAVVTRGNDFSLLALKAKAGFERLYASLLEFFEKKSLESFVLDPSVEGLGVTVARLQPIIACGRLQRADGIAYR